MILITPEAFTDLILAIQLCPVEISGLGRVKRKDKDFLITEIIIFKQTCSLGGTDFDEMALPTFYHELMVAGRSAESDEFCFWWHSHVNMQTWWSGTDEANIRRWWQDGLHEYLISCVLNKRGEMSTRVDHFKEPFRPWVGRGPRAFENGYDDWRVENIGKLRLSEPTSAQELARLWNEQLGSIREKIRQRVTILSKDTHSERRDR